MFFDKIMSVLFPLLLTIVTSSVVLCQIRIPPNPCNNIFAYKQQQGYYYGEINIPYDGSRTFSLTVNVSVIGLYQNYVSRKL